MLIFAAPQCDCHLCIFIENEEVAFLGFKHANLKWVLDLEELAALNLELPDGVKVHTFLWFRCWLAKLFFGWSHFNDLFVRFLNNI